MREAIPVFNTTNPSDILLCPNGADHSPRASDRTGPCADCGDEVKWDKPVQGRCVHVCLVCAAIRLTRD